MKTIRIAKTTLRTSFILSIFVAIAAMFNISLFDSDFKISIGIVLIPIFIFLFNDFSLTAITLFSGSGVLLSRLLLYLYEYHTLRGGFASCYPEMFFYLTYGFLLTLYMHYSELPFQRRFDFVLFMLMDYTANMVEIILRSDMPTFSLRIQLSILSVAFFRAGITWLLVCILQRYHLVLLRKEHADRYRKLMLLISKLSGEVIWMKKNTALIEETMNASYRLFHDLKDCDVDEELSRTALNVAKDIHEIKKEYNLILRGISDALDLNLQDEGMYMREILQILKSSLTASPLAENHSFEFVYDCPAKLYTEKHYFLMSVFRNLYTNAMEAALPGADIRLGCRIIEQDLLYRIEVSDNGPGISADNMPEIFHPGFSTKINYSTGEVSRGLGLNLVQDLVTNQFHGTITVTSKPGNTIFYIHIPKDELEAN